MHQTLDPCIDWCIKLLMYRYIKNNSVSIDASNFGPLYRLMHQTFDTSMHQGMQFDASIQYFDASVSYLMHRFLIWCINYMHSQSTQKKGKTCLTLATTAMRDRMSPHYPNWVPCQAIVSEGSSGPGNLSIEHRKFEHYTLGGQSSMSCTKYCVLAITYLTNIKHIYTTLCMRH